MICPSRKMEFHHLYVAVKTPRTGNTLLVVAAIVGSSLPLT